MMTETMDGGSSYRRALVRVRMAVVLKSEALDD